MPTMARLSALISPFSSQASSSQVEEIVRTAMVALCGMALMLAGPALPL